MNVEADPPENTGSTESIQLEPSTVETMLKTGAITIPNNTYRGSITWYTRFAKKKRGGVKESVLECMLKYVAVKVELVEVECGIVNVSMGAVV